MRFFFLVPLAALGFACVSPAAELLVFDFESTRYDGWRVEGDAFGTGPTRGALPDQVEITGITGRRVANSFGSGVADMGVLTSPEFTIERPYLCLRVGGGRYEGELGVELLVAGEVVQSALGSNRDRGRVRRLDVVSWEVGAYIGQSASLRIFDRSAAKWGYIVIDQVVQSDAPCAAPGSTTVTADKHYLNLPVENHAPLRRVAVRDGEKIVREFDIELADHTPDFWVHLDLTPFAGKSLDIAVDSLPAESRALALMYPSDTITDAHELYREKNRPQLTFSSKRGWHNDPNGLVYLDGEYHLYYQHNPYGIAWGNMHWGHAISRDLVHWEEQPIALYPLSYEAVPFTGSAVIDKDNTSGFKLGDTDVMVVAFTSIGRGECILFSNDRGRSFQEYDGNPVVEHVGRDPRLLWYAPGQHWVMVVYDETDGREWIAFYTSPNLREWTYQSRIEGYFECPELFALPLNGDPANTMWVLHAGNGDYEIGTFDGKVFTPEVPKQIFNEGNSFYAAQNFSNIPASDGRTIQMSWGHTFFQDMPFSQHMNYPLELSLRTVDGTPRLCGVPVRELRALRGKTYSWKNLIVDPGDNPVAEITHPYLDVEAEIRLGAADQVGIEWGGLGLLYEVGEEQLYLLDQSAPMKHKDGVITLRVLFDRLNITVFGNDGEVVMPYALGPIDGLQGLSVFSRGGPCQFVALDVAEMKSIWEKED